jgi:hypothetical protein
MLRKIRRQQQGVLKGFKKVFYAFPMTIPADAANPVGRYELVVHASVPITIHCCDTLSMAADHEVIA